MSAAVSRRDSEYGSVFLGPAEQPLRRLRVRVQPLLTVLLVGTNVIGAGIVFVLSALVIPSPGANRGTVLSLAIGVPVYVVIAVLVGADWGTAGALRSLRWRPAAGTRSRPRSSGSRRSGCPGS